MARLRALKDEDINCSDIPELPEGFWEDAEVLPSPKKVHLSMRLDRDLVDWFKKQGPKYQTRINSVLRSFMNSTESKIQSRQQRV